MGVGNLLAASSDLPLGITVGGEQSLTQSDALPAGWTSGASHPVDVPGDGNVGAIALTVYDSPVAAAAACEAVTKGLLRGGWQTQDGKGVDHEYACRSNVLASGSTANRPCCGTRRSS
jgi:hypothetical protein